MIKFIKNSSNLIQSCRAEPAFINKNKSIALNSYPCMTCTIKWIGINIYQNLHKVKGNYLLQTLLTSHHPSGFIKIYFTSFVQYIIFNQAPNVYETVGGAMMAVTCVIEMIEECYNYRRSHQRVEFRDESLINSKAVVNS